MEQIRLLRSAFRHTYATLLKANREDVKVVQELMRHANSRTTLEEYRRKWSPNAGPNRSWSR
jgi:integrase